MGRLLNRVGRGLHPKNLDEQWLPLSLKERSSLRGRFTTIEGDNHCSREAMMVQNQVKRPGKGKVSFRNGREGNRSLAKGGAAT